MHLVTSAHELVDGGYALRNAGGAHVDNLRHAVWHEGEPDAGLSLRVIRQEVAVYELGCERAPGVRQPSKEPDEILNVTADGSVDREIAVLPDVVDPALGVDLVRSG